jgi:uncharacterized protein (DUF1015 family)
MEDKGVAVIKAFQCVRPRAELANRVAALPYDVYNRKEAKEVASKDVLSFLNIDRPETQFEDSMDMYSETVYHKARQLYEEKLADGTYIKDTEKSYYIYELIMEGRAQTGIVACAAIDDYLNNVIMKHENTREEKERDRIRHVDTVSAQTGPIFLAYRSNTTIRAIVEEKKQEDPLYAFTSEDAITHNIWKINQKEKVAAIEEEFVNISQIYIADGHHRAASAVKVGLNRRNDSVHYTGTEEFNTFLSVLFPEDQLMIMPYNRIVRDLYGLTREEFLAKVREKFQITESIEPVSPTNKYSFGMYLAGQWYKLTAKKELCFESDPVKALDVSILQDYLLEPVLGITDPRTDHRIDFIGGIRGLSELEKRVAEDMTVAFSVFPTSIQELFAVADAKQLMPPKSTWFEPKLRSGLFIHEI